MPESARQSVLARCLILMLYWCRGSSLSPLADLIYCFNLFPFSFLTFTILLPDFKAQESSKSNTALIGKGKGVELEGNGRGSFSYGGAQVIGASGGLASSHGDVNFPGMPTFLPVMQHPGGIGVPAVGMAFPGYVNDPGSGNTEMTWLPVLAGPAGALAASYYSPYLFVDGTYHSRPSGQVSSLAGASRHTQACFDQQSLFITNPVWHFVVATLENIVVCSPILDLDR